MFDDTRCGRDHEVLRRWTSELYQSFGAICYQHRVNLRRPVIRIMDIESAWGKWDPNTRTITIARQLIDNYSWDAVEEVLKHEMAHMVVDEIYNIPDHAHGESFRQACDQLGIVAWASASHIDLEMRSLHQDTGLQSDQQSERNKLLDKVRKLLSLAGSGNENEAIAAMNRVRALYAKHNLDSADLNSRRDRYSYKTINLRKRRTSRQISRINSVLTSHFFVEVIYSEMFDAQDLVNYRCFELVGTYENIVMAEHVYHFLSERIDTLWKLYRRENSLPASAKSSYQLGLLDGFDSKLKATADYRSEERAWKLDNNDPDCKSLVRQVENQLADYLDFRHPRLSKRKYGGRIGDGAAYAQGQREGSRIVVHKPMEKGSSGTTHLLNA